MFFPLTISKKEWLWIGIIIVIGLVVFLYKIHLGALDYIGDYTSYISTAQFFAGMPGVVPAGSRILKPLEPLANAFLVPLIGWQAGFLVVVGLMYCFLVVAVWVFFKNFFSSLLLGSTAADSDLRTVFFYTAAGTALFALSYPMLRYGLDAYTETGALLFYILALTGTWHFLKKPTWKSLIFTLVVAVLGFLWKEYVIVAILIIQIGIVWHPLLAGQTKRKIQYLAFFDGIFLVCNLVWQGIVYYYLHYNYLQWYLQGGESGFHSHWSVFIVVKSLFALLIAGWLFVPFGFLELRKLYRENLPGISDTAPSSQFFFWLVLFVPFICLGWGAVSSRLFYVCAPALIILCLLGLRWWVRRIHDQASIVVLLLAIDFFWLLFHL
jgi:hypothetical protein